MGTTRQSISILDLGKGALDYVPDLPELAFKALGLATLRPSSKRSLPSFFESMVARHGNNWMIRSEEGAWTYNQVNAKANQMARGLLALGVKPGDSVALLSENSAELLIAVLAVTKASAVAALLNHNQKGDVLQHSVALVKPKVVLVSRACSESLQISFAGGGLCNVAPPIFELSTTEVSALVSIYQPFAPLWHNQSSHNLVGTQHIVASSPAFYIFTSGTTGMPKASVMSHYRWLYAMTGMGAVLRLKPYDVFYCCLPLYHNNALTVSLGVTLAAGACFALDVKFSASRFWERIDHYEATAFCYIGELLRYLINQSPKATDSQHGVHSIIGNGLRPEIWAEFENRFGIHRILEFYGASESNMGFMNAFGLRETVGFSPVPYEIIEVDPDTEQPVRNAGGRCTSVKRGEVGLLISEVTDRRPFDGYTDPAANEKKLLRNVFKKNDVWFNSGDLVRRQGWHHIQFVDRLGDTFRWKGENVATSEVEGVLTQLPWVEHAAVYGVQVPGADGRAGMAAITLRSNMSEPPLDELLQWLKSKLPGYAVPLYIRVTPQVETTGTFKYQKVALKREAYDTTVVTDPLFVLQRIDGVESYRPLSA